MEPKKNIGRNELCTCGSGKKYKNCCYNQKPVTAGLQFNEKTFDPYRLNQEIAYVGELGKKREEFAKNQEKQLKSLNDFIYKQQIEEVQNSERTISCHKGCSMCCSQYIPASLQECEAIVYYLYNHERKLVNFINNYKKWEKALGENKSIIDDFQKAYNALWESEFDPEKSRDLEELGARYAKLKIPCPFLKDNACMIYGIRPLVCSSQVAVSPPEYCDPDNPDSINQELILMIPEAFEYLPFYYDKFNELNLNGLCMPFVVNSLLEGGYLYLTALIDDKEFNDEVDKDDQVKKTLDAQLDYYEATDPDFEYVFEDDGTKPENADEVATDEAEDKSEAEEESEGAEESKPENADNPQE
jgi:Fe-S-cluster containining protein